MWLCLCMFPSNQPLVEEGNYTLFLCFYCDRVIQILNSYLPSEEATCALYESYLSFLSSKKEEHPEQ